MVGGLTRKTFDELLHRVLARHGVDPKGTSPVPFDEMTLIGRAVRQELDYRRIESENDLRQCFEWLLEQVLDRSMTPAGRKMAIGQLAAGFRLQIVWPS